MQDGSALGSSQAGGDGDDASPQGGPAGHCVGTTGQHADRAQQVVGDRGAQDPGGVGAEAS